MKLSPRLETILKYVELAVSFRQENSLLQESVQGQAAQKPSADSLEEFPEKKPTGISDIKDTEIKSLKACTQGQAAQENPPGDAQDNRSPILVDIGTDHGFVPVEAVRRGFVEKALACDIGTGPLERAKEHIAEAGLEGSIETRLSNGYEKLAAREAEISVIAGMGGQLMKEIIDAGRAKLNEDALLILSPQSDFREFRRFLIEEGFAILRESCIIDEGKYYFIMLVIKRSSPENYRPFEYSYGRQSCFDRDSLRVRGQYLDHKIKTLEEILAQLPPEVEPQKRLELELRLDQARLARRA